MWSYLLCCWMPLKRPLVHDVSNQRCPLACLPRTRHLPSNSPSTDTRGNFPEITRLKFWHCLYKINSLIWKSNICFIRLTGLKIRYLRFGGIGQIGKNYSVNTLLANKSKLSLARTGENQKTVLIGKKAKNPKENLIFRFTQSGPWLP